MEIILNGNKEILESEMTVKKLLESLEKKNDINLSGAVVLIDEEIIKREFWGEKVIVEGNSVEVLSFVSGG